MLKEEIKNTKCISIKKSFIDTKLPSQCKSMPWLKVVPEANPIQPGGFGNKITVDLPRKRRRISVY